MQYQMVAFYGFCHVEVRDPVPTHTYTLDSRNNFVVVALDDVFANNRKQSKAKQSNTGQRWATPMIVRQDNKMTVMYLYVKTYNMQVPV